MAFQPVKPRIEPNITVPNYVSFRTSGQIYLSQALRETMMAGNTTHLEVEYDAVDQRMRFRPGSSGIRLRYNIIGVSKDIVRPFTYYRDLGVYRTRRHKVVLSDDGWWYTTRPSK